MQVSRSQRPSAAQLLEHPWMRPSAKGVNAAYIEMLEVAVEVEALADSKWANAASSSGGGGGGTAASKAKATSSV